MREYFITPIDDDLPAPHHTELVPRCFTCSKFPVCNLRSDYLKTAQLIENIIGNPQEDYQLDWKCSCDSVEEEEEEETAEDGTEAINTTYFSARLDCYFYEQQKGLSPYDGVRRMIAEFPNGIPMSDGTYYHLATYHFEKDKVPCYNPFGNKVAFAPMPYCSCNCKKPTVKRGDLNA